MSTEGLELTERVEEALKLTEAMTALELSNYAKAMREKFGIEAAPMAMMGAAPGAPAAGGAAAEEKDEFDVILASAGGNKIQAFSFQDLKTASPKPFKHPCLGMAFATPLIVIHLFPYASL